VRELVSRKAEALARSSPIGASLTIHRTVYSTAFAELVQWRITHKANKAEVSGPECELGKYFWGSQILRRGGAHARGSRGPDSGPTQPLPG